MRATSKQIKSARPTMPNNKGPPPDHRRRGGGEETCEGGGGQDEDVVESSSGRLTGDHHPGCPLRRPDEQQRRQRRRRDAAIGDEDDDDGSRTRRTRRRPQSSTAASIGRSRSSPPSSSEAATPPPSAPAPAAPTSPSDRRRSSAGGRRARPPWAPSPSSYPWSSSSYPSSHVDSAVYGSCDDVSSRYRKVDRIGEGTYGVVYRAVDRVTGDVVALKRCLPHHESSDGFPLTTLREITILRELDREGGRDHGIVGLRDVTVSSRWVMVHRD
jgi:hypothetical protein